MSIQELCENCGEHMATVTLEPYGSGRMAVYNCPECGESYDTNIDGTEAGE